LQKFGSSAEFDLWGISEVIGQKPVVFATITLLSE